MLFTYDNYIKMIKLLKKKDYSFVYYNDLGKNEIRKEVIIRHDVDFSLKKCLKIAEIEYKENVKSTFFILLSTNFYNIFSKESSKYLLKILELGHDIGLHFDEKRYEINNYDQLELYIEKEKYIIENYLSTRINAVSMHRPSKWILENDIKFKNIENTYSKKYIKDYKYLSDSRMFWREDVINTINTEKFQKLHILTHPFWYSAKNEDIKEKLLNFIEEKKLECFYNISNNIKNVEEIIKETNLY